MRRKFKATILLMVSASLAVLTLPEISPLKKIFEVPKILELLNHVFIAATIGGIADWFGVTALFHKPLGIGFHTEVLKRNRARIMDSIVFFFSEDLLNPRNIMRVLRRKNFASSLINYVERNNGRTKIKIFAKNFLLELLARFNADKTSKEFIALLEKKTNSIDLSKFVDATIQTITNGRYNKRILSFILEKGYEIFQSQYVQRELLKNVSELKKIYTGDSTGRSLVFSSLNLSDEKILTLFNNEIKNLKVDTQNILNLSGTLDNETSRRTNELIKNFELFIKSSKDILNTQNLSVAVKEFFSDQENSVKNWIETNIKTEDISSASSDMRYQSSVNSQRNCVNGTKKNLPILQEAFDLFVDTKLDKFISDIDMQKKFDERLKIFIENLLDKYCDEIPKIISKRLNEFSDAELIEFIENHISEDLQMIRINGSICGAVVGLFLYATTQIVEEFLY